MTSMRGLRSVGRRLGHVAKRAAGGWLGMLVAGTLVVTLTSSVLGLPLWAGALASMALILQWGESPRAGYRVAQRMRRRIRERPRDERYWNTLAPAVLPPLVGSATWSIWPSAGEDVDPAFYSITAQVVPILFLAGIVEAAALRTFARQGDDLSIITLLVVGLAAGALEGEALALYAVASSTTSPFLLGAVVSATLLQFALLVLMALSRLR